MKEEKKPAKHSLEWYMRRGTQLEKEGKSSVHTDLVGFLPKQRKKSQTNSKSLESKE